MPKTEAQKRAANKYSKAHYVKVGPSLKKEVAEEFRQLCAEKGSRRMT